MATVATSRLATELAAQGAPWQMVEGSAVLADLSGFTRLTEALVSRGPEGVELLHRSLTTCFDALLGTSLDLEGDVLGFAGDAALVWFDGADHPERAARAAAAMPRNLAAVPASLTARTRLHASIGLHSDEYLAVPLQVGERMDVTLCGPAMTALARLEQAAESEQVLMSAATAHALAPAWSSVTVQGGIALDRRRARRSSSAPEVAHDDAATGNGEHRVASVGFVMVPGLDALFHASGPDAVAQRIGHVADLVARVAAAHAVTVLDTDVGVDCVKFCVAAGVPRSVDDDDARLLRALRRIVDDAGVPLRAGAQRGPVFSGWLGVRSRRTFTVLGDTVNVAARALGRADDGDLVIADGMAAGLDRGVTALPMGPQQLKSRIAPMSMWRVAAVTSLPRRRPRATESTVERFRSSEWEQLATLWKETIDGGGASVAIVGEAGMGATELVASLVDLAGGAGTSIVADRFLRDIPYSGVNALVLALAVTVGELPAHDVDAAFAWLGAFKPDLPLTLQDWAAAALGLVTGDASSDVEPGTAARRARQVLVALLGTAAPRHWLLAVEDADHLDHASQQVVAGLAAQATSVGCLVVTTHERADPLSGTADVSITLDAIADDVVTRTLHELAPHLRDDQIARLVAAAGGNPLVLSALLGRADDPELPDSIQQLAAVIVDSLPDHVRSTLLDAAVFGMEFDATTVATVLGDTALASPMLWRQAEPVLRTTDDRIWRFRHDAYREVAYRTSSFTRRRLLHGAIADHVADQADADPGLLAIHLHAAGRDDEAYPRSVAAAVSAADRGAAVASVDLYELAISMARRSDRPALGRLHAELGRMRFRSGDLAGATAAYRAAARHPLDATQRASVCEARARVALAQRRLRSAQGWIRRGLTISETLGDAAIEITSSLLLDEAERLDLAGKPDAALVPARRVLEIAERLGSKHLRARAHLQLEAILFNFMDPEGLEHGRALVDLATELGDDHLLEMGLNNTGLAAMYLGRWEEALEQYQRARTHAERCGHALDTAKIDVNTGFLLYRRGRLDDAEALARDARRVLTAIDAEWEVGLATLLLAMIAIARSWFDDGASSLADARKRFEQLGDLQSVVDCDVVGMDLLLRQDRSSEVVERAAVIAPELEHAETEVTVSFERILGAAEIADPVTAASGVERLRGALARARELNLLYEVYLCLGALADATGDADTAAEQQGLAASLGIVDPTR
jgi:class 3 adenylate cyclase/tetratricopeptide (TPR) repeat protein